MTQPVSNDGPLNGRMPGGDGQPLGMVIEGSVTDGVEVRLDSGASVERVKVGTFVTIQGAENRFFGVVTNVGLGSTDPKLKYTPLPDNDSFVTRVLQGTVAFGTVSVLPQLTMPEVLGSAEPPAAAATHRKPRPKKEKKIYTNSRSTAPRRQLC